MTEDQDLDAALAAFERQKAVLERAIEACAAEQAQGRTGHAAFTAAKEQRAMLIAMATVLQQRINDALDSL